MQICLDSEKSRWSIYHAAKLLNVYSAPSAARDTNNGNDFVSNGFEEPAQV